MSAEEECINKFSRLGWSFGTLEMRYPNGHVDPCEQKIDQDEYNGYQPDEISPGGTDQVKIGMTIAKCNSGAPDIKTAIVLDRTGELAGVLFGESGVECSPLHNSEIC